MQQKERPGNLMAIKEFFGMSAAEIRSEALSLSDEEKEDLGRLCREALQRPTNEVPAISGTSM